MYKKWARLYCSHIHHHDVINISVSLNYMYMYCPDPFFLLFRHCLSYSSKWNVSQQLLFCEHQVWHQLVWLQKFYVLEKLMLLINNTKKCYLFWLVLLWQEDCVDRDLLTADSMQSGVPVEHIEMVFHRVCLQHPCSFQASANEQHNGHVQLLLPSEVGSYIQYSEYNMTLTG